MAVTKHAKRGGVSIGQAKRGRPRDDETPSPNRSELDSTSLRQLSVANLPKMGKPEIGREATSRSTCRTDRGDWRERGVKELVGNREIPQDSLLAGRSVWEDITRALWWGKSDGLIVAMKPGNAGGAKGPACCHVCEEERRAD